MAFKDTVTNALDKVRGLIRREPKAMDAFGGDDLFAGDDDGEERSSNLGPKIAIIGSGVMFLALVSLIGAIVMTGDETAVPIGSLDDVAIEEEADPTAATDRSAERRPWLTPTDVGPTAPRRLGVSEDVKTAEAPKPADPAQVAKAPEPAKPEPAKAEPAKAPTPTPAPAATTVAKTETPAATPPAVAPATPPATPAPTQQAATTPAATPPAAATPAPATPAPATKAPAPAATTVAAATPAKPAETASAPSLALPMQDEDEPEETEQAALPSLMSPAGTAPGAPRRFDASEATAANTAAAGGRPRLNEPRLPPTDSSSVGAPPPRFSAIAEIKALPADSGKTNKIAVVVEGLGLNRAATEAALTKLPPSVTLAFSPYARDLKRLMERAKAKGHEVLIEVPMEGKGFPAEDPGPLGLLTGLEAKDNQERLDTILKEATGATGVFDGMGSKFRESPTHIGEMLAKLKQQSLFYVQGRPGVRVGEVEVPSATADVVIDERPFRAAVDARFDYAEKLAKYQGSAVAVMSARPISFERLALWVDQLPNKGLSLAPVSQVLVQ